MLFIYISLIILGKLKFRSSYDRTSSRYIEEIFQSNLYSTGRPMMTAPGQPVSLLDEMAQKKN